MSTCPLHPSGVRGPRPVLARSPPAILECFYLPNRGDGESVTKVLRELGLWSKARARVDLVELPTTLVRAFVSTVAVLPLLDALLRVFSCCPAEGGGSGGLG